MMTEKRKTYTAEFKQEAVRLVTEQGYGVAKPPGTWASMSICCVAGNVRCRPAHTAAFPGKGRLSPEQEELHRLREENKRLTDGTGHFKKRFCRVARHL